MVAGFAILEKHSSVEFAGLLDPHVNQDSCRRPPSLRRFTKLADLSRISLLLLDILRLVVGKVAQ